MFVYQLISIELIVGVVLIGVLASRGKSIAERVVSLICVPLSFIVAFILAKLINVSMLGGVVDKFISSINGGADVTEETYPTLYGISKAAAVSIGKHILLTVTFLFLLCVFSIIVHLIFKSQENRESSTGKNVASCVIGGVKYFLALMLSLLPLTMLLRVAKPVADYARQNQPKDTYAYELSEYIDDKILDPLENSVLAKVNRYSGVGFLLDTVSDSISTQNVTLTDKSTAKVNINDFLRRLVDDGLPVVSAYECFKHPTSHKLGDVSDLPRVMKDISSDKAMSCFVAELIASSSVGKTDDPIVDKFISAIKSGDPSTYSKTFETMGKVFETLIEKDPSVLLSSDDVVDLLIKSMKDKEFSEKISEALASSDIGSEIAYEITSKALDSVGDTIGVGGLNINMELFKQLFGEENVAKYAEILIKVSELIDELGGMGNITPDKVISKFDKVGALLDALAVFEGKADTSFEVLTAIAKDASYAKYFAFIGAAEIIARYENNTSSFEQSFAMIRDHFTK